jgi:aryl-alcohol dehydrogenase-like predicted oxidoreductase
MTNRQRTHPVPARTLGDSGLSVSELSLGSWHTWDRMDFAEATQLVRYALDSGITLFDVAHYDAGPHREGSETDVLFGKIVAEAGIARSEYVHSQKLWLWDYPEKSLSEQLDRDLARAGTDHADVVVLGDFLTELDLPRLVTEVAELVRAGTCAHWGFNNWAAEDVQAVHAFAAREGMPTPCLAQLKYSLCRRSVAEGDPYRRIFADLGVSLQASDIFEGGILAGSPRGGRRVGTDTGNLREKILSAVPELGRIAAELDATPAQLAIAFCLGHPATATVLFGAGTRAQLDDDLGALDLLRRHGDTLRDRVAGYWLDRDVVDPRASWGTEAARA